MACRETQREMQDDIWLDVTSLRRTDTYEYTVSPQWSLSPTVSILYSVGVAAAWSLFPSTYFLTFLSYSFCFIAIAFPAEGGTIRAGNHFSIRTNNRLYHPLLLVGDRLRSHLGMADTSVAADRCRTSGPAIQH